jgi:hypothetical protein
MPALMIIMQRPLSLTRFQLKYCLPDMFSGLLQLHLDSWGCKVSSWIDKIFQVTWACRVSEFDINNLGGDLSDPISYQVSEYSKLMLL